jgi:hypothetical protein
MNFHKISLSVGSVLDYASVCYSGSGMAKTHMFRLERVQYRGIRLMNMSPIYECKQLCFDLMRDLIEVKLMWIPSHVG